VSPVTQVTAHKYLLPNSQNFTRAMIDCAGAPTKFTKGPLNELFIAPIFATL